MGYTNLSRCPWSWSTGRFLHENVRSGLPPISELEDGQEEMWVISSVSSFLEVCLGSMRSKHSLKSSEI